MHCDNIGQQETAALQKQVKLVSVQAAVQEVNTVSVGSKKFLKIYVYTMMWICLKFFYRCL